MGKRNPKWHGRVPAFVVKDGSLSRSARWLYADLCCHADDKGLCRRSLERVAEQEGVTTRGVQKWIAELEAAGLIVKTNDPGTMGCFRVIRDPEQIPSAKVTNLRNVVARRMRFSLFGKKGAAKRAETRTSDAVPLNCSSPPREQEFRGTPVNCSSPEHSHLEHTRGTLEGSPPDRSPPLPVASPPERAGSGLRRVGDCLQGGARPNGDASLADARKALADRAGGWGNVIALPDRVLDDLALRHSAGDLTDRELREAIG